MHKELWRLYKELWVSPNGLWVSPYRSLSLEVSLSRPAMLVLSGALLHNYREGCATL